MMTAFPMTTESKLAKRHLWTAVVWALSVGVLTIACHSSPPADVSFHATAEPLRAFSYDSGLVPAASPAQIELKLSAKGALTVDAAFTQAADHLAGVAGGGKVTLDVHVKMDGRLKLDSPVKQYDGDLPGLKDIDIPIAAGVAFDPFLLDDGRSADVSAELPETKLPPIPLGSVPGTLTLTILKGSVLTSKFHGSCVSVAGGQASYTGTAGTSGKLLIAGTLALSLPAPFDKTVDLPTIEVPIAESTVSLTSEPLSVSGVTDWHQGACGSVDGGIGADAGAPAPDAGADARPDAGAADASGADAASPDFVEGTFDGTKHSLSSIGLASVDQNGTCAIYASANASLGYPQIDLFFPPATGTTTCTTTASDNIIFSAASGDSYQAEGGIAGTDCTVVVTRFGPVGSAIEGTFTATMKQTSGARTIQASGSFHVTRQK